MKKKFIVCLLMVLTLCGCQGNTNGTTTVKNQKEDVLYSEYTDKFSLLADIKEADIYLYGLNPSGMILYKNEEAMYFDWPSEMAKTKVPVMSYSDLDGDSENELAIALNWGKGTSISMMDLHILKFNNKENSKEDVYTLKSLLANEIDSWFTELNVKQIDKNKEIVVEIDDKSYQLDIEKYYQKSFGELTGINHIGVISYKIDTDNIIINSEIGLKYSNIATYVNIGSIEADVIYDGKNLTLSNFKFIESDE